VHGLTTVGNGLGRGQIEHVYFPLAGMNDVGLDVSSKKTSICVLDRTGAVVREGVVDSDPGAISVYVRSKASDAVCVGLESGQGRMPNRIFSIEFPCFYRSNN